MGDSFENGNDKLHYKGDFVEWQDAMHPVFCSLLANMLRRQNGGIMTARCRVLAHRHETTKVMLGQEVLRYQHIQRLSVLQAVR